MTRQECLTELEKQLDIGRLFLLKYDSKLPEDQGNFGLSNIPYLTFDLQYVDEDNRASALTYLGSTFGRREWLATLEYRGRHFDWHKMVDGVKVNIYCARKLDAPESFPVDPKEFPIQLEDIDRDPSAQWEAEREAKIAYAIANDLPQEGL